MIAVERIYLGLDRQPEDGKFVSAAPSLAAEESAKTLNPKPQTAGTSKGVGCPNAILAVLCGAYGDHGAMQIVPC